MKKIRDFFRQNDEFLASILGIFSSLAVILNAVKIKTFEYIENVNLFTDYLNLIVLFFGLIFIRKSILIIREVEIDGICKRFNISSSDLSNKLLRTNSLIGQLFYAIRWFVIILIGFYGLQVFMDWNLDYDFFQSSLIRSDDFLDLFRVTSERNDSAAKFLSIEVLTNATNLFSATFLFTAFLVLFSVTLEDDNRTSKIKNQIPIAVAVGITVLSIVLVVFGIPGLNLEETSTIVRLLGGLYNGVAMALLFSRFISMEYYFQRSTRSFERVFYFYGITIWLPLYVVVQPLYALFNLFDFAESSTEILKAIVFLITFWGKLVFLFFIFTMLNKKWIHSYILLTLIENENLEKLSIELEDVEKLKITNGNHGS
ncbi:hypothetical protein [Aquimarina sp. MMG016]|uniref:hypothetical protein n=1 Tax=Aquimarina sp. MMG016 TaxID=2822690 RepID=UPI001B3A6927|nr:hypothetical protein [Aquimarina sp. MMG016]MBQ4821518.1 hypothetical protein [Aquimarina sp. MMG016]